MATFTYNINSDNGSDNEPMFLKYTIDAIETSVRYEIISLYMEGYDYHQVAILMDKIDQHTNNEIHTWLSKKTDSEKLTISTIRNFRYYDNRIDLENFGTKRTSSSNSTKSNNETSSDKGNYTSYRNSGGEATRLIIELWLENMTVSQIAKQLNIRYQFAYGILSKNGYL